jgi:hypothetical protein
MAFAADITFYHFLLCLTIAIANRKRNEFSDMGTVENSEGYNMQPLNADQLLPHADLNSCEFPQPRKNSQSPPLA